MPLATTSTPRAQEGSLSCERSDCPTISIRGSLGRVECECGKAVELVGETKDEE